MRRLRCPLLISFVALLSIVLPPAVAQQSIPAVRVLGFSMRFTPADIMAFRQAVASAIDKDALARAVAPYAFRQAQPAHSLQHPDLPGHQASLRPYSYDPAAARTFFAQIPEGQRISTLTILIRSPDTSSGRERQFQSASNEAVRASLMGTLGITVVLQPVVNFAALVAAIRGGAAPLWMVSYAADPSERNTPGLFAVNILKEFAGGDEEVAAALERADAARAEEAALRKALLVPLVHSR